MGPGSLAAEQCSHGIFGELLQQAACCGVDLAVVVMGIACR